MVRSRTLPLLVGVLLLVAGCPADPGAGDGGPDDADAAPPGGLTFVFEPSPELPAALGGDYDTGVVELTIQLANIRAVGDSATVSRPGLSLEWGEADPEAAAVSFGEAPIGRYSRLEALVSAYSISGSVVVGGVTWPFEIEDQPPSPIGITVPLTDVTVEVGFERRVQILVTLAALLDAVAWDQIEADGEELVIGPEDPEIGAVRAGVATAFVVGSTSRLVVDRQ